AGTTQLFEAPGACIQLGQVSGVPLDDGEDKRSGIGEPAIALRRVALAPREVDWSAARAAAYEEAAGSLFGAVRGSSEKGYAASIRDPARSRQLASRGSGHPASATVSTPGTARRCSAV